MKNWQISDFPKNSPVVLFVKFENRHELTEAIVDAVNLIRLEREPIKIVIKSDSYQMLSSINLKEEVRNIIQILKEEDERSLLISTNQIKDVIDTVIIVIQKMV
jgi:hypothetical protein